MRTIAVAFLLMASVAFAKPKKGCEEYCDDDKVICMKVCKERGGPKVQPYCGQACGDAHKACEASCKGKKK